MEKNLHLLKTDNPSRLMIDTIENKLYLQPILHEKTINVKTQNIYITNSEEIKEGDWYFDGTDLIHKKTKYNDALVDGNKNAKKIILTTDPDLIADGVQTIDDTFLQWFVKNPSCEKVKINVFPKFNLNDRKNYGIIIPQEEPNYNMKQEILDEMKRIEKPKQETLEEAADKFSKELSQVVAFYMGAKWQQERSYSEEEVIKAIGAARVFYKTDEDDGYDEFKHTPIEIIHLLKQFKKK